MKDVVTEAFLGPVCGRQVARDGLKMLTPRSMALTMAALDVAKGGLEGGVLEERRWRNSTMRGRSCLYADTWLTRPNHEQMSHVDRAWKMLDGVEVFRKRGDGG